MYDIITKDVERRLESMTDNEKIKEIQKKKEKEC